MLNLELLENVGDLDRTKTKNAICLLREKQVSLLGDTAEDSPY